MSALALPMKFKPPSPEEMTEWASEVVRAGVNPDAVRLALWLLWALQELARTGPDTDAMVRMLTEQVEELQGKNEELEERLWEIRLGDDL